MSCREKSSSSDRTASVVLSYMKSCRRETITGIGTVIVGTDESKVHLAEVDASKTHCDSGPGARHHAGHQRRRRDRGPQPWKQEGRQNAPPSPLTLYGASPLVEAKGRGTLVFERLDQKGERQQIELTGKPARRANFTISPAPANR